MNKEFIIQYTPTKINDFYIDSNLKKIINSYIELDNINILFFGDSGTGKTSLINAIVNEYYKGNLNDSNIIYINNLKDNGIHNIRQTLKTFCQMTTIGNLKKTIVFDDIDLINEQIQQIIRHCIDKHNHKINFIGSCSNIQKVLDNIQSCINIIKLYPVRNNDLYNLLNNVLNVEQICINQSGKDLLINLSQSSIRNLLNYIYKIKLLNNKNIDDKLIEIICPSISYYKFDEFFSSIKQIKPLQGYNLLNSFIKSGYSVMDIYENFFNYIKITNLIDESLKFKIYKIISKYIQIFYSKHEDNFELLLFTNEICEIKIGRAHV